MLSTNYKLLMKITHSPTFDAVGVASPLVLLHFWSDVINQVLKWHPRCLSCLITMIFDNLDDLIFFLNTMRVTRLWLRKPKQWKLWTLNNIYNSQYYNCNLLFYWSENKSEIYHSTFGLVLTKNILITCVSHDPGFFYINLSLYLA